jgi:hypothetical protein
LRDAGPEEGGAGSRRAARAGGSNEHAPLPGCEHMYRAGLKPRGVGAPCHGLPSERRARAPLPRALITPRAAARRWGKTPQEMKDKFSLNSFYLDGADGKQWYYTHLQSIAAKPGQAVKRGDLVGYVGAYNGKNAHLHLSVDSGPICSVLACAPADSRKCV